MVGRRRRGRVPARDRARVIGPDARQAARRAQRPPLAEEHRQGRGAPALPRDAGRRSRVLSHRQRRRRSRGPVHQGRDPEEPPGRPLGGPLPRSAPSRDGDDLPARLRPEGDDRPAGAADAQYDQGVHRARAAISILAVLRGRTPRVAADARTTTRPAASRHCRAAAAGHGGDLRRRRRRAARRSRPRHPTPTRPTSKPRSGRRHRAGHPRSAWSATPASPASRWPGARGRRASRRRSGHSTASQIQAVASTGQRGHLGHRHLDVAELRRDRRHTGRAGLHARRRPAIAGSRRAGRRSAGSPTPATASIIVARSAPQASAAIGQNGAAGGPRAACSGSVDGPVELGLQPAVDCISGVVVGQAADAARAGASWLRGLGGRRAAGSIDRKAIDATDPSFEFTQPRIEGSRADASTTPDRRPASRPRRRWRGCSDTFTAYSAYNCG